MASIVYRCPTTGQKIEVLACGRRARWRPDIRGAAVLRLSLRASHQSIRCRNAGRRLKSALEDVLIDKFGARRAKRRARVRKAARSHLPTAGAHATAVRLKLVPSHQAWDRPHLSSTRVRGLRVGPAARGVPPAQPNRRRAPTSGIRGVDHTTSHRVPRGPTSKGTIRNLARCTSRPGRFHHAKSNLFPLSSRHLHPPVPDRLRRGSRVPTFSDVPRLHGEGRCARGPVTTPRS